MKSSIEENTKRLQTIGTLLCGDNKEVFLAAIPYLAEYKNWEHEFDYSNASKDDLRCFDPCKSFIITVHADFVELSIANYQIILYFNASQLFLSYANEARQFVQSKIKPQLNKAQEAIELLKNFG